MVTVTTGGNVQVPGITVLLYYSLRFSAHLQVVSHLPKMVYMERHTVVWG